MRFPDGTDVRRLPCIDPTRARFTVEVDLAECAQSLVAIPSAEVKRLREALEHVADGDCEDRRTLMNTNRDCLTAFPNSPTTMWCGPCAALAALTYEEEQ